MNIYDFDGTICFKDSTFGFWKYCMLRRPWILMCLPIQFFAYVAGIFKWQKGFHTFYCFLPLLFNDKSLITKYCDKQMKNMCDWYMQQKQNTDVIVSASPEFLIKEMCDRLGVSCVASQIDFKTGKVQRSICRGQEKVIQFREKYPDVYVDKSYGNSESDKPIIAIGERGYMVKNHSTCAVTMWQLK